MGAKDRIKKTVSNIDPDGVKKFAEVSQDTIEKAQNLGQRVKKEQQGVEDEEADLNSTENEVEDDLKAEEAEITEGEEEGNPAEIEDAEKKMEQILDFLTKEERKVDDIESKLKDELESEGQEIQIVEKMEKTADKDFGQALQTLKNLIKTLQNYREKRGKLSNKNFTQAENALQEIRYSAELFRRTLKLEDDLIRQLEETKEEEWNLEKLANRLENELGIDKKEIKQLIRDSEKLQIREDVKEAKNEAQTLSQLIKHSKEEESEIRNLEQELEAEVNELGNILGEDEKILEEMAECRELLEDLDQLMREEKGLLSFGGNSSNAKQVLNDIEKTDQQLKTMLNEERDFVNTLEENYDKIAGASRSAAGKLVNSKTITAVVILIILVLGYGFAQGNL